MDTHAGHMHSAHDASSLNRIAALATLHCLTGCAIGEVLGMVIGTALGLSNAATIALAVVLAFTFGYSLTMLPLLRAGLAFAVVVPLAFASDSLSIAVMEIVDNGVMLAVPGAMDSPLSNPLFWGALALALAVAYVFAFPLNRYLIARGRGHAVVHQFHGHGDHGATDHEAPTEQAHTAHAVHGGDGEGHDPEPAALGSSRRLILVGLSAIAVTIGVTVGGAVLVQDSHSGSEGEHATVQPGSPTHGEQTGHPASGGSARDVSGLAVADGGLRLQTSKTLLHTGRRSPFSFSVTDANGPVRDFETHGGVRMHLIVVRRDLTGYQHLHPTLQSNGTWRTELTLPAAGVYRAYADFERRGEKTVLATDLFVAGNFTPSPLPRPTNRAAVGDYAIELTGHPEAGAETTLTYRIVRNAKPVDVEPYLGAAGHLVALRQGDLGYLHVHPLAQTTGEVRFAATFPTSGNYRLFLQFKDEGQVQTVPLTLSVGGGH